MVNAPQQVQTRYAMPGGPHNRLQHRANWPAVLGCFGPQCEPGDRLLLSPT